MSIGTHAPHAPRLPRRTPIKWPGSGDIAALIGILVFLAAVVTLAMVPGSYGPLQLGLALALVLVCVGVPLLHRLHHGGDASIYLLLPTIMSATQNVYLLPAAHAIGKDQLQVFIVLNFLVAALTLVALWMFQPRGEKAGDLREIRLTTWLMIAVTGWGFATVVLFHTAPTAAFASYRNFVTPFMFLLLGLLASRTCALQRYLDHLVRLGVFVVVFGFFERFTGFWQWVPLPALYAKKNLPVNKYNGLPPNFLSSETLGGEQLRRMVSSFADPVNLGTFLFVVFVAAWFNRRWLAAAGALVAAGLAISKAALVGLLMYAFLRTRLMQSPTAAFLVASFAAVAGLGFYVFSESSSTGSTAAHIHGLTSALSGLPSAPLGHGMGGTGVLAGLFATDSSGVSSESGIGVVISQLGVIGVVIFAALFVMLTRRCLQLVDQRQKVMALSLLVGFVLNAMFNEVALSPNSAAPYFVILGLLIGAQARREESVTPQRPRRAISRQRSRYASATESQQ